MKNLKFYVFLMALFVGMVSVSSCSDDGDDKGKNNDGPDSCEVTSYDQLKYFQDNIVELDSAGNLVQRVNGIVLDKSEPQELYVGVANLTAADSIFKSWLSPDTQVSPLSGSATDWQASLKDSAGVVKNTIYFKKVEEPSKTVAEITFANEDDAFNSQYCTKVVFYKSNAWPENAGASPYFPGDIAEKPTYTEGTQNWVCIRAASQGTSGLLMYISKRKLKAGLSCISGYASPSLAKTARNIVSSRWSYYETIFKEAGRTISKDAFYWIKDGLFYVFSAYCKAIRFSDGKIDWFDIGWKKPYKSYLQVQTFGLVTAQ